MSASINSNFPSIHLIPSSGQGIAIQQQIENNKHEIAKTQKEKAEIQSEITKAQKEKAEAQRQRDCYKIILDENLKIIDYSQQAIKACEESKEITNQIISNNEKMIGIYETLMARNNLQQVNSLGNENQNSTKTQIVFADIAYNPPKIDFSKYDIKPIEPQKTTKTFNQITKDYKPKSYSSSIFNDWFSGLKFHSLRFFKWL